MRMNVMFCTEKCSRVFRKKNILFLCVHECSAQGKAEGLVLCECCEQNQGECQLPAIFLFSRLWSNLLAFLDDFVKQSAKQFLVDM